MDFYRYWNEVSYSCFKKGFRKKKRKSASDKPLKVLWVAFRLRLLDLRISEKSEENVIVKMMNLSISLTY